MAIRYIFVHIYLVFKGPVCFKYYSMIQQLYFNTAGSLIDPSSPDEKKRFQALFEQNTREHKTVTRD